MEWVNKILDQMWPNVDSYATLFVKTFIEPKLHNILDLMQLNQVSGFQIKAVELGSIPARVNGIKVYDMTRAGSSDATAGQEVLLDCDISYQVRRKEYITQVDKGGAPPLVAEISTPPWS